MRILDSMKVTKDKMHFSSRLNTVRRPLLILLSLASVLFSSLSFANKTEKKADRWFEIEMILFARNQARADTDENFSEFIKPIKTNRARTLLTDVFPTDTAHLNALKPDCEKTQSTGLIAAYPELKYSMLGETLNDLAKREKQTLLNSESLMPQPSLQQAFSLCQPVLPHPLIADAYADLQQAYNQHFVAQTPLYLPISNDTYNDQPHLIDKDSLKFKDEVLKLIYRKDITPLMHLGWRQPIRSQRKEKPWRIFAGKNYSKSFSYLGEPLVNQTQSGSAKVIEEEAITHFTATDLRQQNEKALAHQQVMDNVQALIKKIEQGDYQTDSAQFDKQTEQWQQQEKIKGTPSEVWQLDGLFKIYLRHYLFVEAEFNIRKPDLHPELVEKSKQTTNQPAASSLPLITTNGQAEITEQPKQYLYAYHFNQKRRIRSKEIHYFDHPMMGIVLQVRQYTLPEKPVAEKEPETEALEESWGANE